MLRLDLACLSAYNERTLSYVCVCIYLLYAQRGVQLKTETLSHHSLITRFVKIN